MKPLRALLGLVPAVVLAGGILEARSDGSRGDTLAIRVDGRWVTWWRRDFAPLRWNGQASLAGRVTWQAGIAGIVWGELDLRGAREAWRTRVIVVRLDPGRVRLSLAPAFTRGRTWTAADADSGVALALDAGQFRNDLPWGWVVHQGHEMLSPEYAPLAGAVVVDSSGSVRVVAPDSVGVERRHNAVVEAFQSYPMLLQDGMVPASLREPGHGVSIGHRDARLALGTTADGQVVIALTRFDALGTTFGRIPFGLTSAEMAAVMGALGCREAVALDGGISGQLLLRDGTGSTRTWPGVRPVPLGLIARPNR